MQTFFLSGFIEAVLLNYLIFSKNKPQSALYFKWVFDLKAVLPIEDKDLSDPLSALTILSAAVLYGNH